uniref:cilia- and flagella-associated protein 54 isoform X3 n=1 Tax=Pristiophorus japonicus TaxID=55135 RepID=UPI00398F6EC5
MESSVPLSTVRYLRWRATLYTAVCQCYYDCESGIHAETFARRALGKISELSQLETMGSSPQSPEVAKTFTEATVKVSVMIFRRAVFESRRKPKGILRPKQKTNYKEAYSLPWPHNATENLLVEMFNGSAAQFLAVTEALSGGNRRVLQAKPPFPAEQEVIDVTIELLLAGLLILSGGAGNTQLSSTACTDPIGGLNISSSLIELAATGEDGVSVEAAMRFAKIAFCCEHFDIFDAIIAPLLTSLRKHENPAWKGYQLDLNLLIAMEPLVSVRKPKHSLHVGANCAIGGSLQPGGAVILCDDLVILAEAMLAYTCTPLQDTNPDIDMVVDAVLFLWRKCKTALQKGNFGMLGPTKFRMKLDNFAKWIYILTILQEVTLWCKIGDVDPVVMVDITLNSVGMLESLAESSMKSKKKTDTILETRSETPTSTQTQATSVQTEYCAPTNILMKHPAEQLVIGCKMLEKALESMAAARSAATSPDGRSLIDISRIKVPVHKLASNLDLQEREVPQEEFYEATAVHSLIMDLHLELIQVYYRVAFKLLKINLESTNSESSSQESSGAGENYGFTISTEEDIIKKVMKNNVLKAIFRIQKVMSPYSKKIDRASKNHLLECHGIFYVHLREQIGPRFNVSSERRHIQQLPFWSVGRNIGRAQEAVTLLQKAEAEEKKLYSLSTQQHSSDDKKPDIVPAPILLSRTNNSMTFKPAPFVSSKKVYWYRIFGRTATGTIFKVRLLDFHLEGTGQEVPAFGECLLKVTGIQANEKYIFAVAAYSQDGKIIGNGIGKTTTPILAYYPLPILTAWTYLCQTAYKLEHYPVAKVAFSVLWNHFVSEASLPPPDTWFISKKTDWCIIQKSLNGIAVSLASPILLRSFLGNIFIDSDINCKEEAIFCDSLSDSGPLYNGQLARLAKCERMLVAIEIAGWINDSNQALQVVVQCYGLLAPVIFHRVPSTPVVQILIKCLCVLQDVVGAYRQKKQFGVTESVQHMTACVTYHLAKILRCWKEYDLALEVVIIGKRILHSTLQGTPVEHKTLGIEDEVKQNKLESSIDQQKLSIQTSLQMKAMDKSLADLRNEVKTEALHGNDASNMLYTTISFAPLYDAYNAVMWHKDEDRFLEYFAILLHRAVREEKFKHFSKWMNEATVSIKQRNKTLLGKRITSGKRSTHRSLKNAAIVVEYHNIAPSQKPKKETVTLKELVDSFLNNPVYKMDPSAQRKQREILEKKAKEVFQTLLRPIVHNYLQLKKFHQVCNTEMPWLSQINYLSGIVYFNSFMKCFEEKGWSSKTISRYSFLDTDIFTLHNSGALLEDTEGDDSETMLQSPETQLYSLRRKEKSSESTVIMEEDNAISESIINVMNSQLTEETDQFTGEPSTPSTSAIFITQQLNKAFVYFKKAMVIAHRGGHWTILQNACRLLWNCAHVAMMYVTGMDSSNEAILSTDRVKSMLCLPFNLAAQNLLDMIVQLQNTYTNIKFVDSDGVFDVPSCVGGISDDEGGFNLKFEHPFDDVTVVDLHWVCAMVLYSLELLCNQKKWESLVYLAIQFNAVTHERYALKVTPLLVYAQDQLCKRIIEYDGPPPPQPHLVQAAVDSGTVINCRNFLGKKLKVLTSVYQDLETDAYSGGKRANALVSVPVDVKDTLSCFRESLVNSNYVSRALRHSRKLLALLLAYTQQRRKDIMRHLPGKVGFSASPTHIENSKPADLSNEDFLLFEDVLSKPLPWSQVSLVILSYDNSIELLRANSQNDLRAQALHEQGNLQFYAGNRRAAFKCWSQAIDAAVNMTDFVNNWQHLESNRRISLKHSTDYSEALLYRAGIWGCLLAGVLAAKIAQFIVSSDFRFRLDCCILSTFFLKGLFRTTFPHPRSDFEYASYEIGFDCDVVELIPGIDLFSDRFRADIRTVVGSLHFLLHQLHSANQNLLALPMLTLYQYFVSAICRDVKKSVEARILKVRVLADLGLFSEAFAEQCVLINGDKIPQTLLGGFRHPKSKAVEQLLKTTLSPVLRTLYGHYLESKFELGRTYLIIKLAETINHIPEKITYDCPSTVDTVEDTRNIPEMMTNQGSNESEELQEINISKEKELENWRRKGSGTNIIDLDTEDVAFITRISDLQGTILECEKPNNPLDLKIIQHRLTMSQLKDIILTEAQNKLNIFMDTLKMQHVSKLANLPPAELEATIDAKLQCAAIAFQRLQPAFSAAIALSAVQLLQRSSVLVQHKKNHAAAPLSALKRTSKKSTLTEDHVYKNLHLEPYNVEARGRLHMGLWLKCRLAMVTALTAQIYGVGLKKEEEDFLETSRLCEEGIEEAKAYRDVESQTEFMLQAVLLDLRLGRIKNRITTFLQNIVDLLNARQFISPTSHLLLAKAMLQLSDLRPSEVVCISKSAVMQEKIDMYLSAQKLILDQLVLLGESTQHQADGPIYSCPALPLKNIYLSHIIVMAKIKIRLGYASAQLTTCSDKRGSISSWQGALSCLSSGLELCREAACREFDLEADFLFQKGKIMRQLTEINYGKTLETANFLMEAINVTYFQDQNIWLMRQSYLELVLLYFYLDEDEREIENNLRNDTNADNKQSGLMKSRLILVPKQPKKKITGQGRLIEILQYILRQPSKCKMLAWVAIRAANEANRILQNSQTLTRDKTINENQMENLVQNELREHMLLDILASHEDFQTENDEMLPRLTTIQGEKVEEEEQEDNRSESVKIPNMTPYRRAAKKLTSVHLLRCNNHLRRLYNTNQLPVRSTSQNVNPEIPQHPDVKISSTETVMAQIQKVDTDLLKCAMNNAEDGVHTPVFNTGICLRLGLMHSFLMTHLPEYKTFCCVESIPIILYELFDRSLKFPDFQPEIYTSVFGEYMLTSPGNSYIGQLTPQISKAVYSSEKELRVQWYLPALVTPPTSCETQKVLFIYAFNVRPITLISLKTSTLTNGFCGYKWIYLKRVLLLLKNISALKQKSEMLLQAEIPQSVSLQRSIHKLRQRYIRTDSSMNVQKLPPQMEDMVSNLCNEIKELLDVGIRINPESEVPFKISFENLDQLEKIFTPAIGHVLKQGGLFTWLTSFLVIE